MPTIANYLKECENCGHLFNLNKHEGCPKCEQAIKELEKEDRCVNITILSETIEKLLEKS